MCYLLHRSFLGVALKAAPKFGPHCISWLRKRSSLASFREPEVRRELEEAIKQVKCRGSLTISGGGYAKLK